MLTSPPAFADGSDFKIGIEGFYDKYREPIAPNILVDDQSIYGSVNASYTYNYKSNFVTLEGRGSRGLANYKSPSGSIHDIPQYEAEGRLLGGFNIRVQGGHFVIPYLGIGGRYYFDNNKGNVTNLGLFGYDRRITQFYIPLGVGMHIKGSEGWIYSPLLEFDILWRGTVKSRLGEIPGFFHIENEQTEGYGVRGEFMVGKQYQSFGWEAGPFFRYWNIADSKITTDPGGTSWIEPHNTRAQLGIGARINF